jgi:hypothetical protein
MGRRSRARTRAADPAGPPAEAGGRSLARRLNPIRVPTRARTRNGAIAFALASALFALLDWLTGASGLRGGVIPLAILAVLWGIRALTMPADAPPDDAGREPEP